MAVPSLPRKAVRFGLRIAGVYLVVVISGLLFANLLHAMLNCRAVTGIDLTCTLFGIDVGSPLVPFGVAVTVILYVWPLVALVTAISFGLAAVSWFYGRMTAGSGR
jgi:hypothetical protein